MKLLMVAAALSAMSLAVAAQEMDRGAMLALSCAACHGTDGTSRGSIPSISGQSETVLIDHLMAFRTGKRSATVMGRIAKGYSEDDIAALARHYAGLKGE